MKQDNKIRIFTNHQGVSTVVPEGESSEMAAQHPEIRK